MQYQALFGRNLKDNRCGIINLNKIAETPQGRFLETVTAGVNTMKKELAKIFPKDVADFYSDVLRDLRGKNNLKADEYLADKVFEELKNVPIYKGQTSWVDSYKEHEVALEVLREALFYALSVTASKQNLSVIRKRLAGLLNKALTDKGVLTEAQAEGNFIETNLLVYLNYVMSEDLSEGESLVLRAMSVLVPAKALIRDSSFKSLIELNFLTTFDTLYEVTKIILYQSGTGTSAYLDLMDKAKLQGLVSYCLSGISTVFEGLDKDTQKNLFENREEDRISNTIEWRLKENIKSEFIKQGTPIAPNVSYRKIPKFISTTLSAAGGFISGAEESIFACIFDKIVTDEALRKDNVDVDEAEVSKRMERYATLVAVNNPVRKGLYGSGSFFTYASVPDTYKALRFYLDNKETIESSSDTEFELIKGVFAASK